MKKTLVLITLLLAGLPVIGQTSREELSATPEKTGGVYYAYPEPVQQVNTAAPKGYKPFYISHYGRHGSRYLISGKDYTKVLAVIDKAEKAGALTAETRRAPATGGGMQGRSSDKWRPVAARAASAAGHCGAHVPVVP